MAVAPTCPECQASMVAAEATGAAHPFGFRRNGWVWDASVLLCTKCGAVRLRAVNQRHEEGRAAGAPEGRPARLRRPAAAKR